MKSSSYNDIVNDDNFTQTYTFENKQYYETDTSRYVYRDDIPLITPWLLYLDDDEVLLLSTLLAAELYEQFLDKNIRFSRMRLLRTHIPQNIFIDKMSSAISLHINGEDWKTITRSLGIDYTPQNLESCRKLLLLVNTYGTSRARSPLYSDAMEIMRQSYNGKGNKKIANIIRSLEIRQMFNHYSNQNIFY